MQARLPALALLHGLLLAGIAAAVPGRDEPPTADVTGRWDGCHPDVVDYVVTINRTAEGKLVTRWHNPASGRIVYAGEMAWDAKAGGYREVYSPDFTRCHDWLWVPDGGRLSGQGWVLKRPGVDL